jgi:hypothetical protein
MAMLQKRVARLIIPCLIVLDLFVVVTRDAEFANSIVPASLSDFGVDLSTRVQEAVSWRSPSSPSQLSQAMDQVVRMLLPSESAQHYILRNPSHDFRFYVYETLPENYTWQYFAKCTEQRYNVPDWHLHMTKELKGDIGTQVSNCDWGSSICTQVQSSSSDYSARRFNRNGDVVLSKIFSEYQGPLRTFDPVDADVFIVPYAATAHCVCRNDRARCKLVSDQDIQQNVLQNLPYLNQSTMTKHVFLSSVQRMLNHPFMKQMPLLVTLEAKADKCLLGENCGHVIQPYVNTNGDFQPNSPVLLETHASNSIEERKYAIGAVMSRSIGEKFNERNEFLSAMELLMKRNQTVAGRQVNVTGLERRVIESEDDVFSLYRNSVFCPCFRGNTPAQKRFFDVLLSGCIPVIIAHDKSHEKGHPSFFQARGTSIRLSYPFSKGIFHNEPSMGIDYRDLVVMVNGTCGIPCLVPTVENLLLHHPERLRQIQEKIASVATLFSYGMEDNALKSPDAVAAILVQIRHHLLKSPIHP